MATPIDLSGWHAETMPRDSYAYGGHGQPTWTTSGANNDNVRTSGNSAPAVYCSPDAIYGNIFEGSVKVPSGTGDDDFFGWAIGFQPGDFTNPSADYYLIDWKMNTQNVGGICGETNRPATLGMALSHVTGTPSDPEFFQHKDFTCTAGSVTEMARATTLASTGWQKGVDYEFKFKANGLGGTLSIDGTEEIFIPGALTGKFCFYTFSQDAPTFTAVKGEPVSEEEMSQTSGTTLTNVQGDPHFNTWKDEHFEYHGQCDLVLAQDPEFADDLGLDLHIRTKIVRYWSYIKNAALRIGNDILEIEGTATEFDSQTHYWINNEYQGEMDEFAGFPVKFFAQQGTRTHKNRIEIDLSSKYPGHKIVVSTFREFVKVSFEGSSVEAYGDMSGMLGDFKTGKTFARDGVTELHDYTEYGHEWQVLPSNGTLFHEVSHPQFPAKCLDPEDPRGDRRRQLAEANISVEQAEEACCTLKDQNDRQDCVYDVLATQDLDMVGAF